MLKTLLYWDRSLFLFINGAGTDRLDAGMQFLSSARVWIPLYLLVAVAIFRKHGWRAGVAIVVLIGLTAAIADWTSVHFFKDVFMRLRPTHEPALEGLVRFQMDASGAPMRGGLYGFVSSHAANHFALATLFAFFVARHTWHRVALFSWALAIGYSRVYLGFHYPADVLVGCAWGVCLALLPIFVWQRMLFPMSYFSASQR